MLLPRALHEAVLDVREQPPSSLPGPRSRRSLQEAAE
jgi:hypothetical protein